MGRTRMSTLTTDPAVLSPLGSLTSQERSRSIAALTTKLPRDESVLLLSALAGSLEGVANLPWELQVWAEQVLLATFDEGGGVDVVDRLGLADVSDRNPLRQVEAELNAGDVDDAIAMLRRWDAERLPDYRGRSE